MPTTTLLTTTSLGEFTKCLVAVLHDAQVKMPLRDERLWHCLFYELKSKASGNIPFLAEMRFDWDGPYPKSQELSRFLHALHWNAGVSALNPQYSTIQLDSELADLWKEKRVGFDTNLQGMLDVALQRAQSFPQ